MKRLYRIFASWFICLFLVLSLSITSFADVNDMMINTDSNASSTFNMPRSSIISIENTVNYSFVDLYIRLIDTNSGSYVYENPNIVDDFGEFVYRIPQGYELDAYGWRLKRGSLPSPGKYRFQLDFSSDASVDYTSMSLVTTLEKNNVALEDASANIKSYSQQNSGDFYSDFVLEIGAIDTFRVSLRLSESLSAGSVFGGRVKFAFANSDDDVDISGVAFEGSVNDYESDVSSSLSDLSSSVDEVSDEIGFVAEAIQNLQGAMEPHYNNVLTQLHHITEQLHAFYDQVYNNIHLPELDMLTQIRNAIENIDLQIEVDISEVKTAINNMSTAVQDKLQSTTDKITGGYDNSGITQENEKLEQSINQYDEVESGIFDDAEGFIGDFEYPSVDSLPLGIIKALAFVGGFLQGVFLSMGEFSVIITFSLTMIFVMVVVGYHRIRS